MKNPLCEIIKDHKGGKPVGIYSICSSNWHVLQAAIQQAFQDDSDLLIESTSNQVDQFGGYSGMTPQMFADYVKKAAYKMKFPLERIILGGDHLGPNVWQNENSRDAMGKAAELIRSYISAHYTKIHLDTSMSCADDPGQGTKPLEIKTVASRTADLCEVAEDTAKSLGWSDRPLYIIGSDVPLPGGARESLKELRPTPVEEVERTIDITKKAFYSRGLQSAWKRVIAVVVQPGVEFGDSAIIDYDREKAKPLSDFIAEKENLVFEAHSTDYQNQQSLRKMVEDHFVILKVGPALTFAFREAVFALAQIEKELNNSDKKIQPSRLIETLEDAMLKNPKYWQKHYRGNEREQVFARKYSFSDRIRYYWPDTNVKSALNQLFKNLSLHPAPISLLSFFMPVQYNKIREGLLQNNSLELVRDKIMEVTKAYAVASGLVN